MRILLIEDDRRLAKRIQRVLVEERHLVEVVHDGKRALRQADGEFDCLIVDILLPGMNGLALCRWLREHAISTPILLLTALGEVQDKVRGLDSGADDYLSKPFAFDELLARLRALERRKTSPLQVATHLRLGPLSLNLLTRAVQVDGVPITLTVREFALLEYLLRHPRQALTRTQILDTVWPSDTEVNASIVDTYIHYLRTKLERFPGAPCLRTLRSIGYMLTMPADEEEELPLTERGASSR